MNLNRKICKFIQKRRNLNNNKNSYFTYEEYKNLVITYGNKDWREVNFQNRIILPMLEKIVADNDNNKIYNIDVVDVSTQYKNGESEIHTRKYYANEYTPDLLIVRDWNYENRKIKKDNYIAVVEIKSPILDPLEKNSNHTMQEIESYTKIINTVILTDCYTWHFFLRTNGTPNYEEEIFNLFKENTWQDKTVWDRLISFIKESLR